jgi:hypothetical protein
MVKFQLRVFLTLFHRQQVILYAPCLQSCLWRRECVFYVTSKVFRLRLLCGASNQFNANSSLLGSETKRQTSTSSLFLAPLILFCGPTNQKMRQAR